MLVPHESPAFDAPEAKGSSTSLTRMHNDQMLGIPPQRLPTKGNTMKLAHERFLPHLNSAGLFYTIFDL